MPTQMKVHDRAERIQFKGPFAFSERFRRTATGKKVMRVPVVRIGVPWVELQ
jgi:hypothetical protein